MRATRHASVGPSGKTWRFLVLTWCGTDDVVEGNTIEQVGCPRRRHDSLEQRARDHPDRGLSSEIRGQGHGPLEATAGCCAPGPRWAISVRTGDVVSLLNGPAAGEWRRVVQAIDATAYLVDAAIPAGNRSRVDLDRRSSNETFQENRIDIRGGRRSSPLVLAGNHFGTRVIKNHFLGGEFAFKLTAFPTETPVMWGWSHTPFLGGVIEGNILEDCREGGDPGRRARRAPHQDEPGPDLHDGQAQ